MGNPFKDQFLKKGLVTKKQVTKVNHELRISGSKKSDRNKSEDTGVQDRIRQTRQEQAARDRELNRQRDEATKEQEIQGQIRQIIQQNQVEGAGEKSFHFADGKTIKRLYVSKEIAQALSAGEIGIVKQGEQYAMVPAKAALQIKDRKAESFILLNSPVRKRLDMDDPYAEFPIPDDLDW